MELYQLKIAFSIVLLILGLVGGLLPFAFPLKTEDANPMDTNAASYVNAFAGGVLLAASVVHMLPDAADACKPLGTHLMQVMNPMSSEAFPIAQSCAGLAFLSLALIQAASLRLLSARHDSACGEELAERSQPLIPQNKVADEGAGMERLDSGRSVSSSKLLHSCCTAQKLQRTGSSMMNGALAATSESPATAMALVMALVVHSVLEGIGIGAQESTSTIATVFLAVAAHKGMALFALGAQLRRYNSDLTVVVTIVVVALCSPIGIVIGSFILRKIDNIGEGLVLSLASGTFLFVSIPELLVPAWEDGNSQKNRVTIVLMAMVGFILMSFLAFWA